MVARHRRILICNEQCADLLPRGDTKTKIQNDSRMHPGDPYEAIIGYSGKLWSSLEGTMALLVPKGVGGGWGWGECHDYDYDVMGDGVPCSDP